MTNLVLPTLLDTPTSTLTSVATGSMEPTHHVGTTLRIRRDIQVADLEVGQVITFATSAGGTPTTHRITGTHTDAKGAAWFTTKGDANEDPDPLPVAGANVLGLVTTDLDHILDAPGGADLPLGRAATWAHTQGGRFMLFGPILALFVLSELAELTARARRSARRDARTPADVGEAIGPDTHKFPLPTPAVDTSGATALDNQKENHT